MDRLKGKVAIVTGAASASAPAWCGSFAEDKASASWSPTSTEGRRAYRQRDRQRGDLLARTCRAPMSTRWSARRRTPRPCRRHGQQMPATPNCNGDTLKVDEETFDLITAVNMKAVYHAARAVVLVDGKAGRRRHPYHCLRRRPASAGPTWYNAPLAGRSPPPSRWSWSLRRRTSASIAFAPVVRDTGMLERTVHGRRHAGDTREVLRPRFRSAPVRCRHRQRGAPLAGVG